MSESISIQYVIGRDLVTVTKSSPEDEEYDNFGLGMTFSCRDRPGVSSFKHAEK